MNDRILGVGALALAAFMTAAGWGIEAPFAYEPVGPRAFPLLLAGIIGPVSYTHLRAHET